MQKKITAEGDAKEKLFDEYMCYCKNGDEALEKSIAEAETKIPQLESSIKEELAMKKQLEAELKTAEKDRAEAKETLAKATAIREKEAAAYATVKGDLDGDIGALSKAIPAIEGGMSGAFLQTGSASVLKQLVISRDMNSADRDLLASFLNEGDSAEYAPKSGEILGILKEMKSEMEKDLADATAVEDKSIQNFEELAAAKKKEIVALTKAIESKTIRVGELAVKTAETENAIEDAKEGLAEDKKFLADLDKNCEVKKVEMEAYKKMEAEEMIAIADTIKILNDDDALDLFKKTLPSGASFLQLQVTSKAMRQRALSLLKGSRKSADPRVDFVQVALHGGKIGFEKIIKMIDELMATLKSEQDDDDDKKEYCLGEFDKTEDTKKGLEWDISDLDKKISDGKEAVETLTSEIESLIAGIKELDKAVAEATTIRKEEHDEYVSTLAANTAAKELLAFAKNRMNKFYNPKLYVAPPKRELSEEDSIVVSMGGTLAPTTVGGIAGTGIEAVQVGEAPPPPPKADLAFKKSGQSSNGVIAMIDLLIADIDKANQKMEVEEKDAQADYEKFVKDSADKRALDSKTITDKESAKAEADAEVEKSTEALKGKKIELMETDKYLMGLHEECDWLLKYFDARKAARGDEVEALGKAKDVLNGADYSLVQTQRSVHLRGVRRE
jgi:DNA repair exonuclease SbcCD ATPase subunit